MLTLSYFTSTLIALGFLFLGILIHNIIKSKKKNDWEGLFHTSEEDRIKMSKRLKKEESKITQLQSEKDQLKNNLDNYKSEMNQTLGKAEERVKTAESKYIDVKNQLDKLRSENTRLSIDATTSGDRYKKFKEKYDAQAGDYKDKVRSNNQLIHENDKFNSLLSKYKQQIAELKAEIQGQEQTVLSAKESQKELRILRVKNKKLGDDVTYWEKKHYDTHHELADLKKTQSDSSKKYEELESYRNGDQIIMENLKKQIEQYKSKFINVNHKYQELVSRN